MDHEKLKEVYGKARDEYFYLIKMENLLKIMVENGIEYFKDGNLEIKRESLKLQQSENEVRLEVERTKRNLRG